MDGLLKMLDATLSKISKQKATSRLIKNMADAEHCGHCHQNKLRTCVFLSKSWFVGVVLLKLAIHTMGSISCFSFHSGTVNADAHITCSTGTIHIDLILYTPEECH